jgi:hypothetical protein
MKGGKVDLKSRVCAYVRMHIRCSASQYVDPIPSNPPNIPSGNYSRLVNAKYAENTQSRCHLLANSDSGASDGKGGNTIGEDTPVLSHSSYNNWAIRKKPLGTHLVQEHIRPLGSLQWIPMIKSPKAWRANTADPVKTTNRVEQDKGKPEEKSQNHAS